MLHTGPSRLEIQARDSHKKQAENSTATYNLFHTDGVLKNIESELLISYYDSPAKFMELCNMLIKLIPSLEKIELDKKQRKILYYEKAKTQKNGNTTFTPVEFNDLASGIKSIIAIAGDIYLRLSDALLKIHNSYESSASDEGSYTSTVSAKKLFGIVIIDEFDLHLHPKWQKELPGLLSHVFPNVQFIASTHSPIPLLGAPEGSVILSVDRTTEKGIVVNRLEEIEKEIKNLLPNSILTSPIFDLENLFPITHEPNFPIETSDSYSSITEKKKIDEELHTGQAF